MKEINDKLIRVQLKIRAPKNNTNKGLHFSYRSAEQILEVAKPLLAEEGLVLTLSDDIIAVGGRCYVKATATISDGEDTISTSAVAQEQMASNQQNLNWAQVTGGASSYARKYALNGLFCLDDNKDLDEMEPQAYNPNEEAPVATTTTKKSKIDVERCTELLNNMEDSTKASGKYDDKEVGKFFYGKRKWLEEQGGFNGSEDKLKQLIRDKFKDKFGKAA